MKRVYLTTHWPSTPPDGKRVEVTAQAAPPVYLDDLVDRCIGMTRLDGLRRVLTVEVSPDPPETEEETKT